jgi:NTE family protein
VGERQGRPDSFLARAPLFAGLPPDALEAAEAVAQVRRYAAGDPMCRQGEPSESLLILRRGSAQAFVESVTRSSVTTVARFRPGDMVGEIGLLANVPRSATVVARSDAEALEIPAEHFWRLAAGQPRLQSNLAALLAGRLARRNAELQDRAGQVVALVVGSGRAEAASRVLEAARLASPSPLAIVDLRPAPPGGSRAIPGTTRLAGAAVDVVQERADTLAAVHDTVIVVLAHDHHGLAPILEPVDRVLGLLGSDEAGGLLTAFRAAAHTVELVLFGGEMRAAAPAGYRLLRHAETELSPRDAAWLGRHLSRTKLGLVLGAGGAKAFAHAGVIETLEQAGYDIDVVAGSSMGAVVAVWLALGMTGAEIRATLDERCARGDAADAIFRQGATAAGSEMFRGILRETTRDLSFEDLAIPATVMTADLTHRRPCPITTGPLWESLMAALSIPGLYPPWPRGDERLVDAVSLTPVPLDAVVTAGADVTVAVNLLGAETLPQWPGHDPPAPPPPPTRLVRPREAIVEALELAQLGASARETARADVPITPVFGPGTWRHWHLGELFFEAGRQAGERALARLAMLAHPSTY